MIEAVISIELPGVWITRLVDRFDVDVRILDTIPFGEDGTRDLVEMKLNGENLDEIVDFLKDLPEIDTVTMEIVEGNKAIGVIQCIMCFGCRDVIDSHCFLVSAHSKDNQKLEWTVISSDNQCMKDLIGRLEKHGASPEVVKMKRIKDEEMLTENQEKIVRTAYERGYYDFPKRIGVKELADMFEISTATLSEILRRGQRKIIESYFESK
jgi:predicted DNA binding protein